MITTYNVLISLRMYLMSKGITTVIKRENWKAPDEKPFVSVMIPLSRDEVIAKNKELIRETMLLEIGTYGNSEHSLEVLNKDIRQMIRYGTIPLLDDNGEVVGKFSFSDGLVGETHITDDTQPVQNETAINRRYFETRVIITHVYSDKI